jgi:hypothetical protein
MRHRRTHSLRTGERLTDNDVCVEPHPPRRVGHDHRSCRRSVRVAVTGVVDRRRRGVLSDAFTRLGDHIGNLQPGPLGALLGFTRAPQTPGGRRAPVRRLAWSPAVYRAGRTFTGCRPGERAFCLPRLAEPVVL